MEFILDCIADTSQHVPSYSKVVDIDCSWHFRYVSFQSFFRLNFFVACLWLDQSDSEAGMLNIYILYYSCGLWSSSGCHKWNVNLQPTRTGPNTCGRNCHLHLQHWLHTEWEQHAYLPG